MEKFPFWSTSARTPLTLMTASTLVVPLTVTGLAVTTESGAGSVILRARGSTGNGVGVAVGAGVAVAVGTGVAVAVGTGVGVDAGVGISVGTGVAEGAAGGGAVVRVAAGAVVGVEGTGVGVGCA